MKTINLSILLVLALMSCAGPDAIANQNDPTVFSKNGEDHLVSSVMHVEGMTCRGCENSIKRTLGKLDGVTSVLASHLDKSVTITYDKEKISLEELKHAIRELGYQVE